MLNKKTSPAVDAELTGSSLRVRIEDCVRETQEMFEGLNSEERNALAAEAWAVGLRAVSERPGKQDEAPREPIRLSTLPPSGW